LGFRFDMVGRNARQSELFTCVRGSAFFGSDVAKPQDLLEYFDRVKSEDDFRSAVASLNGYFAVICKRDSKLFAAVDRARSIPLFYGCSGNQLHMSDDASRIRASLNRFQDSQLARDEFCMTGYVTGSDTLYNDVKQLRAGELLVAEMKRGNLDVRVERYYDFIRKHDFYTPDVQCLSAKFDDVLMRSFERLVALANGRTIVVPLSGGWDSRLVVLMLRRLGYDNMIAFTYGRPGNLESEISRKVARSLGIEWYLVPYSNEAWRNWFWSEYRVSYFAMAHNGVSHPHIQDWPAVWELKNREVIPDDAVFVPGHIGDFLAGSTGITGNLMNEHGVQVEDVVEQVYEGHYFLTQHAFVGQDAEEVSRKRIATQLGVSSGFLTPDEAAGLYKKWVWQERQAKFIVNSVRVYEFWGYDWWLPLGDLDMRDFWLRVPLGLRINKRLYVECIKELASSMLGSEHEEFQRTERDTMHSRMKNATKRTPFMRAARWLYRKFKKAMEYEKHPMAWYGVMSKDTFLRYYHEGYVSIDMYLVLYEMDLIDL
jgi:asparagine synthase (glutamine-hydrolysing)